MSAGKYCSWAYLSVALSLVGMAHLSSKNAPLCVAISIAFMCVFVCMCVCMYVCVYVCMYMCMYVYVYVCMCVCMYVSTPEHLTDFRKILHWTTFNNLATHGFVV